MSLDEANFYEKRRQYRLPYYERIIFTDGQSNMTAHANNVSRGGLFVTSLAPFPIDTVGHLLFPLAHQEKTLCVKAKVAHIVFDRQRCEIECGMGLTFVELDDSQRSTLNVFILNEQTNYLDLRKLLAEEVPNPVQIKKYIDRLPALRGLDLLQLKYKVSRICNLFEPISDSTEQVA